MLNVKYINLLVFLGKSPYLCKYRKGYKNGCSATPPARFLVEDRRYLIYKKMDIQKLCGAFISENDFPSFVKMSNAVVEQFGGVDEYTILNSLDSCRNANDVYTGFCYPSQTCKFWNENESAIIENMQELSDDDTRRELWKSGRNRRLMREISLTVQVMSGIRG